MGASVSGTVRGSGDPAVNDAVGGLLGEAHLLVKNSHSSAKVSDAETIGGLVGFLVDGAVGTPIIINSSTSGAVSGHSLIGGLVGQIGLTAHTELVEDSFATGSISASECDGCGGVAGSNNGSISNSYATGALKVTNCSACGGLIGTNSGNVTASYSIGAVAASGGFVGGLIGEDSAVTGSLTSAYWDLDTSGISDPAKGAGNVNNDPGITGLSDAQLKSSLPPGFDPKVWAQKANIGGGYPYLIANRP